MNRISGWLPVASVMAIGVVLTGCATTPRPEVRNRYEQEVQRLAGQPQAVLATGCVVRDEVGEDYVLRGPSQATGDAAARATKEFLESWGMQVKSAQHPQLCGLMSPYSSVRTIADNANLAQTTFSGTIPNGENAPPPEIRDAYAALYSQITIAAQARGAQTGGNRVLDRDQGISLSDEHRRILREQLGADTVWVVSSSGTQVSTGKSVGVAILSALAGAAVSGGGVYTYSYPVSGSGSSVFLVRLDQPRLVWGNGVGPQWSAPSGSGPGVLAWARPVFAPLFDPEGSPRVVVAGSAPAASSTSVAAAPVAPAIVAPPVTLTTFAAGQTHVTTAPLVLQTRPLANALGRAPLAASTEIKLVSAQGQPDARWWYVKAGDASGWAAQETLQVALR